MTLLKYLQSEIPETHFYDDSLAPPDHIKVRRRKDLIPHPIDLLVLNALYDQGSLHCFEIAQRVYEMTGARLELTHYQISLTLQRLQKAEWVERSSRDPDAGRRKGPLFRLKDGGGSHLRAENRRWRKLAPVIAECAVVI